MIKIYLEKNNITTRYTFSTIFSILGFPYQFVDKLPETEDKSNIYIYYVKKDRIKDFNCNGIIIYSVDSEYINSYNALLINLNEEKLPVFYGKQNLTSGNPLFFYEDGDIAVADVERDNLKQVHFGFDLIKTVFFMISRWEEMSIEKRDNHGRFPSEESILVKLNLHDIAVIDIYIKLLEKMIVNISHERNIPLIQKSLWPNNKKFAVCLTHDVDRIKAKSIYRVLFWGSLIIKCILKFQIKDARIYLRKIKRILFFKADTYWNFKKWLELEKKYRVKSSFYFISRDKNHIWKNKDLRYTINNNAELIRIMRLLKSEGLDVGLHGDYDSYLNANKMHKEKTRIEQVLNDKVYGIRQHYLKFKVPTSWQIQEQAGLLYDTTSGWQDRLGFRCGLSFPFNPYDIAKNEQRKILEIPLTIMDSVFDTSNHQKKTSVETVTYECLKFFHNAEKYGSLITLLWHQAVLDDVDYPYLGQIYEKLLQYLQKKDVFVASGKEIMEWWISREGVKVIEKMTDDKISWEIKANADIRNISFSIAGFSRCNKGLVVINNDYSEIDKTGIVSVAEIKKDEDFKIILHR